MTMNRRTWIAAFAASLAGVASFFGAKFNRKPKTQTYRVSWNSDIGLVQRGYAACIDISKVCRDVGTVFCGPGYVYEVKLGYSKLGADSLAEKTGQTSMLKHYDFDQSNVADGLKSVGLGLIACKVKDLMCSANRQESTNLGCTRKYEIEPNKTIDIPNVEPLVFKLEQYGWSGMDRICSQIGDNVESLALREGEGTIKLSIM